MACKARDLTSPPVVLATMKHGQKVLAAAEVGRRWPSALTRIVTAPLDQILELNATLASPQGALDFELNGALREVDRGWSWRKSVIGVRAVLLDESRVNGVVALAIENGFRKV